ncbi:MAG TPA: SCO family protein [Polyangiaceae bacterium]|jgi:protein SCO1/2
MSTRRWFAPAALSLGLACGVFGYLRPVLGQKHGAHAWHAQAPLPARSLYGLDSEFVTDSRARLEFGALRGHFQILALIFTRCPTVCPMLVHDLKALERAMPADVSAATRFTLVSIDPEHDTPEALGAYRIKHELDEEHWFLLRGEPEAVRDLSALLGFSFSGAGGAAIAHSKLVTVLNRDGEVILQQESAAADPEKIIDAIARAL